MLNQLQNLNIKKHKKELLIVALIICVTLFLYLLFTNDALNIYYGNKNYQKGDSFKAKEYIEKALDSKYSFIAENNLGNISYDDQKYNEAINHYEKSREKCSENCETVLYNLGNSYYKNGQSLESNEKNEAYKKAISSYEKSLEIKEDKEARENLEFVKKELENEQQKSENSKQNEQGSEGQSGDKSDEQSDSASSAEGSEGQSGDKSDEQSGKGAEGQSGDAQGQQGTASDLDEQTKKEVENYMQQLEQIEKDAEQYYQRNPNQQEQQNSPFDDFFGEDNPFRNDPFFNPTLNQNPNSNGTKKDW